MSAMFSKSWDLRRLPGPFGIRVEGIDLALDSSEPAMVELVHLLYAHKVVIIPGQVLDDAHYVRFGRFWGRPIEFFVDSHRDKSHPELIRVSNAPSVPIEHRDGAVQWHSDSSYDEIPASVTMLYCVEAPDVGGETMFSDTAAAYDALPAETQERIRHARALHRMLGAPWIEGERCENMRGPDLGTWPHPLVLQHPVTGRLALYTSATAHHIEGWPVEEGREFIRQLRRHIVQSRFRLDYKLRPGDLMLWDNFSLVHSATPIEYSDERGKRRLLHRISTKGLPPVLPRPMGA
jgi:taurine dioxygenase